MKGSNDSVELPIDLRTWPHLRQYKLVYQPDFHSQLTSRAKTIVLTVRSTLKGVVKEYAKFSPVVTVRLLLHIKILKPTMEEVSEVLPGVVKIDSGTGGPSVDKKNLQKDTVRREVLRHPEFADSVELSRIRDYSSSTSEGPYPAERLLLEALQVIQDRISVLKTASEALMGQAA